MRISYFDFLRCIAIIMVVFIHCFGFCYTYPDVTLPVIFVRNLMNVAVPLFLAISGCFLASKQMEDGGYVRFLKKQIPRVYIPVLFCSLYYVCRDLTYGFSLNPFIKLFSCYYTIYYFIAVIIQCYLLLWFLKKHTSLISLVILSVAGFIWWGLNSYLFVIHMGKNLPFIIYAGNFIPWGVFFVEGLYFGLNKNHGKPIMIGAVVLATLLFLVLSIIESIFIMDQTLTPQGLGQKASIFGFNAFFCILALRNETQNFFLRFERCKIYQLLCVMGRYSFGIYLIHFFVLSSLAHFKGYIASPAIKWILGSIVVLFISFALLAICKKISPKITRILLGV
ncbi:acyltransferase [Fibrobacter sp.]